MNMKNIEIRYIKKTDVKEMHQYVNILSQEKTYITLQGETISLEDEERFVLSAIKKQKNKTGVTMVIVVDKVIAGICGINAKSSATEKHTASLGISISKDFRGQKLGEKLLKKVIAESRKNIHGLKIITLGVYQGNFAIHLYEKLGFKVFGRLERGAKYRGKYIDRIEMAKHL
jgi:RimJ/RimL family protein N-acetyltransferase